MEEPRILSKDQVENELLKLPGWQRADNIISKEFVFESFDDAVLFIARLAPFCNELDHHPDVHIYYKKLRFDLTRFDVGGKLTDRDFKVAHEIERLFEEYQDLK